MRDRTFRVLAAEHEQKQAIIREQAAQEVQAARRAASVKIAIAQMKYWEIIADNLSKAGWSWGCVSAVDSRGRTIWIADAHCDDGQRFIVRADEKLTAFVELESAIRGRGAVS